jgi:uncharacterized protein YkuJ
MIKIDFVLEQNGETFCDALYLEDDHTFTNEEIEAMKQNRFDKFYSLINAVSAEEMPQE